MVFQAPKTPRALSHDETKAAEAAFQGQPFNEAWSEAARAVYEGLQAAIHKLNDERCATQASLGSEEELCVEELGHEREMTKSMAKVVRRAKRSLHRGLAAMGLIGSGGLIGLLALLLNVAPQPAEAGEPHGLREQMIPILGVTMEQTPTGDGGESDPVV